MVNLLYRTSSSPTVPDTTSVKGVALSNLEIDGNFRSLQLDLDGKATLIADNEAAIGVNALAIGDLTNDVIQNTNNIVSNTTQIGANTLAIANLTFDNSGSILFDNSTNASLYPVFADSENSINLNISQTKLSFNPSTGILTATDFNSSSDERLKESILPIESGLDLLEEMVPVSFQWKDSKRQSYGLIAQDLELLIPELVSTDPETKLKSIAYIPIIAILIEAVQTLNLRVLELEKHF